MHLDNRVSISGVKLKEHVKVDGYQSRLAKIPVSESLTYKKPINKIYTKLEVQ